MNRNSVAITALLLILLGLTPLACSGGGNAQADPPDQNGEPDPSDNGDSDEQPGDSARAINWLGDVQAVESGGFRYISGTGVPEHSTGQFPGPGNPNAIRAQNYSFRVPLDPEVSATATPYALPDPFGVALNGVVFDPFAAEFYNNDFGSGWQLEPMPDGLGLDHNHAHVQPNGAYHYHGLPSGLIDQLGDAGGMTLVGFAADGFPIYALEAYDDADDMSSALRAMRSSYRLRTGTRPGGPGGSYDGTYIQDYEYVAGLGDLDECNGRVGATPEFPAGTYYYVITADYPYIPRAFRGTPDATFDKQGGPPV